MPTTFNVISLGFQPIVDTTGGNYTAESAGLLVGKTFGSANNPLHEQFQTFAPWGSGASANASTPDRYDQDSDGGKVVEYYTVDGVKQAFDATVIYNATMSYTDGSTADITAVLFQDWNGRTYWAPEYESNADQTKMEAKPIRSLKINSVNTDKNAGMFPNRAEWIPAICFAKGTMIKTDNGFKPVEDLRAGDLVWTRNAGDQPIIWIGKRVIGKKEMIAFPDNKPIRLFPQLLLVSPWHRILMNDYGREVFVPVKFLVEHFEDAMIAHDIEEIEYYHILLDEHHVINSNDVLSESFYLGPQAMKTLTEESRKEVLELFPNAGDPDAHPLCRPSLTRKHTEEMFKNPKGDARWKSQKRKINIP